MSASYRAVGWNSFKKRYDIVMVLGVALFLVAFVGISMARSSTWSFEILLMRATAVASLILLHMILAIGPLARLDNRWLPLLYNRRHLGVTMFLLALIHAVLAILTYHVGSTMNPIVSVFTTDAGLRMSAFPFQAFGFCALIILFVMAATSHDFWLANLTAPVWKTLHMTVYVAYGLLVVHVAFGIIQAETSWISGTFMGLGVVLISGLHVYSGWCQAGLDPNNDEEAEFVDVCAIAELIENVPLGADVCGERVAVILYEGDKVSCVSGVCQHQNGPLAEGRFRHGCLTCPWHGYQYKPEDGTSPSPFTERIPTFDVKIAGGRVLVRSVPNPAGTPVQPARCTSPVTS